MKKVILLVLVLLVAGSGSAMAGIVPIGDPVLVGSWSQRFEESGVGNFNWIAIQMVSAGDAFETPFMLNFNPGSWSTTTGWDTYARASGPALNWLQFDIKFLGASSNPLVFDFAAYLDNTLKESARATWNGSGWSVVVTNNWDGQPVPEPGVLILLACAAAVIGVGYRKLL